MGERRLAAGGLAPGLHHHHRLGIGGRAQRAHEAPRVADAFHVDQDALRLRVVGQEVQRLRQVDRGVGPERDDGGEADAVVARPVEDGRGERARLRHQAQRPAGRQRAQRAGVELQRRALEAQAVRAQQVHAVAARGLVQLGAQRQRQAAGQDQRGAAAHAADDLECRRHVLLGQRDQCQVGTRLRQFGQRARHRDVEPGHDAGVAAVPQRAAQRVRQRRRRLGAVGVAGEDDDGAGFEEGAEDVAVHGGDSVGWDRQA